MLADGKGNIGTENRKEGQKWVKHKPKPHPSPGFPPCGLSCARLALELVLITYLSLFFDLGPFRLQQSEQRV